MSYAHQTAIDKLKEAEACRRRIEKVRDEERKPE